MERILSLADKAYARWDPNFSLPELTRTRSPFVSSERVASATEICIHAAGAVRFSCSVRTVFVYVWNWYTDLPAAY